MNITPEKPPVLINLKDKTVEWYIDAVTKKSPYLYWLRWLQVKRS